MAKQRKPQKTPPKTLEEFIKRYDSEVARRIRLFNLRDVEEVKWDFYERLLDQEVFEKYEEDKIKGWNTRPSIQNFERYVFHILRTCLINKSNRQRYIDKKMISVEHMATRWTEGEGDSEPFYGGTEDNENETKAPFSLKDILDICHVFPPRMYREVESITYAVSVEDIARLYADGYTESEISQTLKISPYMLQALLADLRVVASMLQVKMRGLCGGG